MSSTLLIPPSFRRIRPRERMTIASTSSLILALSASASFSVSVSVSSSSSISSSASAAAAEVVYQADDDTTSFASTTRPRAENVVGDAFDSLRTVLGAEGWEKESNSDSSVVFANFNGRRRFPLEGRYAATDDGAEKESLIPLSAAISANSSAPEYSMYDNDDKNDDDDNDDTVFAAAKHLNLRRRRASSQNPDEEGGRGEDVGSNSDAKDDRDGDQSSLLPPPPPPNSTILSSPYFGPDSTSISRVIGGTPASPSSHRYMSSLQRWSRGSWTHVCGATLVARDVLLTAAHCRGSYRRAEIGRYNLDDITELRRDGSDSGSGARAVRLWTTREVAHPEYKSRGTIRGNGHDIMLVKLRGAVPKDFDLVRIDLRLYASRPELEPGDPLVTAGWGVYEYERDPRTRVWQAMSSSTLLDAKVYYVDNAACDNSSSKEYTYAGAIDNSMMCASAPGKDACQGDSGGPLLLDSSDPKWNGYEGMISGDDLSDGNDEKSEVDNVAFPADNSRVETVYRGKVQVQIGVVSFGIGCANKDFPGVYSRISTQAEWIQSTVCNLSDVPPPWFNCNGELEKEKDGIVSPSPDGSSPNTPIPTLNPTRSPIRARPNRRKKRYKVDRGGMSDRKSVIQMRKGENDIPPPKPLFSNSPPSPSLDRIEEAHEEKTLLKGSSRHPDQIGNDFENNGIVGEGAYQSNSQHALAAEKVENHTTYVSEWGVVMNEKLDGGGNADEDANHEEIFGDKDGGGNRNNEGDEKDDKDVDSSL